jgi:hypothetical protein
MKSTTQLPSNSSKTSILDAFKEIDKMKLRVHKMWMNEQDYKDVMNFGKTECPLCHIFVDDLQSHCTEINDNDHIILSVHIA